MSHPLQQKIDALRTRVWRLLALYGLAAVVAAVLTAAVLLGTIDYLIRFQDRGLRVICWLVLVSVPLWVAWRHVGRATRLRLGAVDLALRVEHRYPGLGDRLASAVEFLRQAENDPTAGSATLRRAVVTQAAIEAAKVDFADVIDSRPTRRMLVAAAGIALVVIGLAAMEPTAVRTAAVRLLTPWGNTAWPRTTHLALRTRVERVARGQAFEVEVYDARGARLPGEVRVHYRFEGPAAASSREVQPLQALGKTLVARRENVARPFSYWIEGGDDRSLPWIAVQVVEPPTLKSLAVDLFPPSYTGWPPTSEEGNLRALVGTRLGMRGEAAKPLESAMLVLEDGRKWPATLTADGLHFALPSQLELPSQSELLVTKSTAYWFHLTDREGLSGGEESRWEIRAVPDTPPSVTIEQPAADLYVTPRAAVPLSVVAKDDLAVRQIALGFSRSDRPKADDMRFSLYEGPEHVERQTGGGLAESDSGQRRVANHRWEIEPLAIPPGNQVTFYATATDYRGQSGKSESRRLLVITPEELQERMAGRQNLILTELARLLKLQRDCRTPLGELQIRLEQLGHFEQVDIDHLEGAELNQRQVAHGLTSRSDGVPMHILALVADLANNRVDSPDIQRRMQGLLADLDRLDREHLGVIGRELTAAIKAAQINGPQKPAAAADAGLAPSLANVGQHQDRVIETLQSLLGQLNQWDNYRRFHRDVAQLLRDQEEVARRSGEVGRTTLSKESKDLLPQETAELKILASRQWELARRLDRIEQEMEQAGRTLATSDPLAAATVADAAAQSRRLALTATMRSTGGELEENRLGQAGRQQQQVIAGLQEVLDILANRREPELARLVKKLREAEADVEVLRRQQANLRKQLEQGVSSDAAARQKALQEETERMGRRLERLLEEAAKATAQRAAAEMGQGSEAARQGNAGLAAEKARAAEKRLADLKREIAARLKQAEVELAMEQLVRLEDTLKHLHRQQQAALEETRRLAALENAEGHLTRSQAISVHDLARVQQSLQADTLAAARPLSAAGGFHATLTTAAEAMRRAVERLTQRLVDPSTQQAQQQALARLAMLLEALKTEPAENKLGDDSNGSGDKGSGGKHPPGEALTLAELKLLKLMQLDINQRTQQLQEQAGTAKDLTEAQRREYNSLSEEQGRLGDLLMQMLAPTRQEVAPPAEPHEQEEPREEKP